MHVPQTDMARTPLMTLWRGITFAGDPVIRAYLQSRAGRGKEMPDRLKERFGEATLPRPPGKLVWIHAASVGESLSVLALIRTLVAPPHNLTVLLTTGTVTSAQLMAAQLPDGACHQFLPFDRPSFVRRFLDHWQPDLGVWVESELWPTLISEARARGVPLALINARMSKKSFRGWRRWPATARTLVEAFTIILAQDEPTAERFRNLGAAQARGLGNIKLAAAPLACDEDDLAGLKSAIADRPTWCAASIHAREEALVLDAHSAIRNVTPQLLTIIAPRQPDRGTPLADEARARGLGVAQRSLGEPVTPETEIYIADTIGEMGLFFRLAPVAFLGRSLIDKGGSNPLEAPSLGCVVIAGPHTENFADIYDRLDKAGGVLRVANGTELAARVTALIADEPARAEITSAALTLIAEAHEVLGATTSALEELMQRTPDAAA